MNEVSIVIYMRDPLTEKVTSRNGLIGSDTDELGIVRWYVKSYDVQHDHIPPIYFYGSPVTLRDRAKEEEWDNFYLCHGGGTFFTEWIPFFDLIHAMIRLGILGADNGTDSQ